MGGKLALATTPASRKGKPWRKLEMDFIVRKMSDSKECGPLKFEILIVVQMSVALDGSLESRAFGRFKSLSSQDRLAVQFELECILLIHTPCYITSTPYCHSPDIVRPTCAVPFVRMVHFLSFSLHVGATSLFVRLEEI
jgi:hypothetical protein